MADGLLKKALTGMAWMGGARVIFEIIHFFAWLDFSRLLTSFNCGFVGMVVIVMAIAKALLDCGFLSAMIQEGNLDSLAALDQSYRPFVR